MSTTPSRTWLMSWGGLPPSVIDGKTSIFTLPPEAFSTRWDQGTSIWACAGDLGDRKWCSFRLIVWAPAGAASAIATAAAASGIVQRRGLFISSPLLIVENRNGDRPARRSFASGRGCMTYDARASGGRFDYLRTRVSMDRIPD
jgi:hypothetical protein